MGKQSLNPQSVLGEDGRMMQLWRPCLSGGRKLYQSTRYVGRATGRSSAIAANAAAIAAAAAAASKPCAMQ